MTTTFRLRRIIGDTPDTVCDDDIVFHAPRPLYGIEFDFGDYSFVGFTYVVTPDVYDREGKIRENFRNDAEIIEWVNEDQAVAEYMDHLLDHGYTREEIAEADRDDLVDSWRLNMATGTREVD